jgi:hypothetical protein
MTCNDNKNLLTVIVLFTVRVHAQIIINNEGNFTQLSKAMVNLIITFTSNDY